MNPIKRVAETFAEKGTFLEVDGGYGFVTHHENIMPITLRMESLDPQFEYATIVRADTKPGRVKAWIGKHESPSDAFKWGE